MLVDEQGHAATVVGPDQAAMAGRIFALVARVGIFLILAGYTIDLVLSQYVLASVWGDVGFPVRTMPPTEDDPFGLTTFLSLVALGLGHLMLMSAALLWILGRPGFSLRLREQGLDQVVLGLGVAGALGSFTLLTTGREISASSLTYIDTLSWDLFAVIILSTVCWMGLARQGRESVRKKLSTLGICAFVTLLACLAVSTDRPWLALLFGTSTAIGMLAGLQLLALFDKCDDVEGEQERPQVL